jgi:hypothetical protein
MKLNSTRHLPPNPQIVRHGALSIQVCVPEEFEDDQILAFGESEQPCGTRAGWHIRQEAEYDKSTNPNIQKGRHERVACEDRQGYVHLLLDA